jgi:hypothetical protein
MSWLAADASEGVYNLASKNNQEFSGSIKVGQPFIAFQNNQLSYPEQSLRNPEFLRGPLILCGSLWPKG